MATRPAPADAAAIERVLGVFNAFMQRLMTTHVPEFNAVELTMSQAKALYVVMAAGQLRMSELAARLGITSSTATGVVDGLVGLGLLVRHEDAHDRRQVVVAPTIQASESIERMRELNTRTLRDLLEHLPSTDLDTIQRALEILHTALPPDHQTQPQGDRS